MCVNNDTLTAGAHPNVNKLREENTELRLVNAAKDGLITAKDGLIEKQAQTISSMVGSMRALGSKKAISKFETFFNPPSM